ncbi:hypothetical protein JX265_011602 [Neoarthrinium moseri]|uniref:Uncharacterized protein n=1 Tax=Neoarthrinium moseri TaxID=1658444 RepID=A0A9Q0AKB7_9PEZI|nr:hypothetical protein JX265_011602 [Neoarthrinium moseri]
MNDNTGSASLSAPLEVQKLRIQSADLEPRRDSGYFTQSQTPDRTSKQSSRSSSNSVDRIPTQTLVLRSGVKAGDDLSEFDIHVDEATIDRFKVIQLRIETPLLKYVQKTKGKYRAMAIRLMVLGKTAAQAKPHIVVLAAEDQCKRVRKFFDKSSVQDLVRPSDKTLPSFEVLIYGRPPDPKKAEDDIDVLAPLINGDIGFTADTFCGAPIVIRHPSGTEKRATLGGIIKAVNQHGDFRLYGLTAGHVVGNSDDYMSIASASDSAPSTSDELFLSDSETDSDCESDLENPSEKDRTSASEVEERASEAGNLESSETVLMFQDGSTAWSSLELGVMGRISKESPQVADQSDRATTDVSAYFDWALIEMSKYKPNRLRPRTHNADDAADPVATTSGDLLMPPPSSDYNGVRKSVVVITGSEGPKRGTISPLPSRILMGPGKVFVDTLVVNLGLGKEIVDGDSGSWVVNERTLEVYGHVIASDAFGGGYIMPMQDTLRDISKTLQARTVTVASLIDMASVAMEKMDLSIPDLEADLTTELTKAPASNGCSITTDLVNGGASELDLHKRKESERSIHWRRNPQPPHVDSELEGRRRARERVIDDLIGSRTRARRDSRVVDPRYGSRFLETDEQTGRDGDLEPRYRPRRYEREKSVDFDRRSQQDFYIRPNILHRGDLRDEYESPDRARLYRRFHESDDIQRGRLSDLEAPRARIPHPNDRSSSLDRNERSERYRNRGFGIALDDHYSRIRPARYRHEDEYTYPQVSIALPHGRDDSRVSQSSTRPYHYTRRRDRSPRPSGFTDSGYSTARNSNDTMFIHISGERGYDSGYSTGRSSGSRSARHSTTNSQENTPFPQHMVTVHTSHGYAEGPKDRSRRVASEEKLVDQRRKEITALREGVDSIGRKDSGDALQKEIDALKHRIDMMAAELKASTDAVAEALPSIRGELQRGKTVKAHNEESQNPNGKDESTTLW